MWHNQSLNVRYLIKSLSQRLLKPPSYKGPMATWLAPWCVCHIHASGYGHLSPPDRSPRRRGRGQQHHVKGWLGSFIFQESAKQQNKSSKNTVNQEFTFSQHTPIPLHRFYLHQGEGQASGMESRIAHTQIPLPVNYTPLSSGRFSPFLNVTSPSAQLQDKCNKLLRPQSQPCP